MPKTRKTRPSYTEEFKAEAVRKCLETNANRVSKELGVSVGSLRDWMRKSEATSSNEVKPSYEDLEQQVRKLKKELGYVNEINDILKKSTAIFSNDKMRGSQ